MPQKLKWPVAKIREDGMPAIWLNWTNWTIIREGIVSRYLLALEDRGRVRARREARAKLPATWKRNSLLKSWAWLDNTESLCGIRSDEALDLYRVGRQAHPGANELTVEKLISLGEVRENQGYQEELVRIEGAPFTCEAA